MPVDVTLSRMPTGVIYQRSWSNEGWRHASLSRVVAIPACNEATRIDRCLTSVTSQHSHTAFGVLVLVNGTTDATFRQVVAHGRRHARPLCVVDTQLPSGRRDAGAARCVAMQLALSRTDATHGAVFTTDADSVIPEGWLDTYGRLLDTGYHVVAGTTEICPDDANDMPRSLRQREQWERRYETCLDALEARLDPVDHNPWPRHYQASGANLAMNCAGLSALSQVAWPGTGEDKHIVAQAEAKGLRVRHDTIHKVLTSGRLFGRARGGMADTMRQRILVPDSPCDERLESVDRAYFRARTRRLCRDMHEGKHTHVTAISALAARLRLSSDVVAHAIGETHFGAAWATLEQLSPRLRRNPITPGQLMHQCTRAEALLARLSAPARPDETSMVHTP